MAARKPLRVVGFMQFEDGRTVKIEDLTAEELERCQKKMLKRLENTLNEYYSSHPEEFKLLKSKGA